MKLMEIVDEIGPTLAAIDAEADQHGEFVGAAFRLLKERRLFSAGVPKALGGGDATHGELCEMVHAMARHAPSTALALSMHTHLLATAVWRQKNGQPAPLLASIAQKEIVLATSGASDWLESSGEAVPVEGGYRVTARKPFVSALPAAAMILTSVVAGDEVLHFAIAADAEGVRLLDDWDTLGMRGTGSCTLLLEDAFVPHAAVSLKRPRGEWHPLFNALCVIASPLIMSAYVGIAERAVALALQDARKRAHAPLGVIGAMENALVVAQATLRESMIPGRNYDFVPNLELTSRMLALKTTGANAVRACVENAVAVSGGGAFYKKHALERLWRDVQAVQFHPLPEHQQLEFTGRVKLAEPRAS